MGINEATFYVWKKRYGNLGLLEIRELRQLRDENARLKRLVAYLTLNCHILEEGITKKIERSTGAAMRSSDGALRVMTDRSIDDLGKPRPQRRGFLFLIYHREIRT